MELLSGLNVDVTRRRKSSSQPLFGRRRSIHVQVEADLELYGESLCRGGGGGGIGSISPRRSSRKQVGEYVDLAVAVYVYIDVPVYLEVEVKVKRIRSGIRK